MKESATFHKEDDIILGSVVLTGIKYLSLDMLLQ